MYGKSPFRNHTVARASLSKRRCCAARSDGIVPNSSRGCVPCVGWTFSGVETSLSFIYFLCHFFAVLCEQRDLVETSAWSRRGDAVRKAVTASGFHGVLCGLEVHASRIRRHLCLSSRVSLDRAARPFSRIRLWIETFLFIFFLTCANGGGKREGRCAWAVLGFETLFTRDWRDGRKKKKERHPRPCFITQLLRHEENAKWDGEP